MAKLMVLGLVLFVSAALTSCSDSRPLPSSAGSSDLTDAGTLPSRSATTVYSMESTTTATQAESKNIPIESEELLAKSDTEEFADEFEACREEDGESTGGPCRRMLPDYNGTPDQNPDYKNYP